MKPGFDRLPELTELAVTAARAAGDIINLHRQSKVQVYYKDRGTSAASQEACPTPLTSLSLTTL